VAETRSGLGTGERNRGIEFSMDIMAASPSGYSNDQVVEAFWKFRVSLDAKRRLELEACCEEVAGLLVKLVADEVSVIGFPRWLSRRQIRRCYVLLYDLSGQESRGHTCHFGTEARIGRVTTSHDQP
jgi:hypothetical protein